MVVLLSILLLYATRVGAQRCRNDFLNEFNDFPNYFDFGPSVGDTALPSSTGTPFSVVPPIPVFGTTIFSVLVSKLKLLDKTVYFFHVHLN